MQEAYIVRTPGINGRRMRVSHIYYWHEVDGLNTDDIASRYALTLAQIYAALSYAFDHMDEIQNELRAARDLEAEVAEKNPSKLNP